MIQWLTTLNSAREIAHLSRHYVVKSGDYFMVLTSKEIPNTPIKTYFISKTNVEQQEKSQYFFEKIHKADYSKMTFRVTEKGRLYWEKFQLKLQPFVEKMQPFIEKAQPVIEKLS